MEGDARERTCNFCDFSRRCRMPDGVVCEEEHHQQGKDWLQYYAREACEFFKEEQANDCYDLIEERKKQKKRDCEDAKRARERIKKEIERLNEDLLRIERKIGEYESL